MPLSLHAAFVPTALQIVGATAGLIVSEATHVAPDSVSRPGTAAIHDEAQVAAWRRVTDAVHAAGGRIVQQLFHLGRKADPARRPGGGLPVAPSPIAAITGRSGCANFAARA